MATVNLTIAARGNHPRGRKPYIIENTIDLAVATSSEGTALAASDVYQCLNIPAESVILHAGIQRSEEHTSELQSHSDLVCRLLLEKKNLYGPAVF